MYQIKKLQKFPNLVHGFSTVDGGNMSFRYGDKKEVIRDRKKFLSKLNIKMDNCVAMWNQHGNETTVVEKSDAGKGIYEIKSAFRVDSLATDIKGLYLILLIADCLPVILFDPKKKVICLVHAGWKGVDLNIASKAVDKLVSTYKCNPSELVVGFGPAIRKDSYIKENPVQLDDPKWEGFIISAGSKSSKYKIDAVSLCRKQLIDIGVKNKNIYDCGVDTVRDKRFFSHYRDEKEGVKDQGRFACVLGMR